MGVQIIYHQRDGERSVHDDLADLRNCGISGCIKDAARILAAITAWQQVGFQNCPSLVFRPIEGPPSNGKMYEAKYEQTSRSDGIHGYRIFYVETRHPKTQVRVAVLLTLWAKQGSRTPDSVIAEAWRHAEEVRADLETGAYFEDE